MGFNPSTDYPGFEALSVPQRHKVLESAIDQLTLRGAVADYAPILWDCVERQKESLVLAWKRSVRLGRLGERDVSGFSPAWDEFFNTTFLYALPRTKGGPSPSVKAKLARETIDHLKDDIFDFLEEAAHGSPATSEDAAVRSGETYP